MLWFNSIGAAVTVDDRELPQYQVQRDFIKDIVTCWIPSEAGKAFSIKWGNGIQYHSTDTSARVWIDGTPGDGMIANSCTCNDAFHAQSIDRVTVSSTTARPMLFSIVEQADSKVFESRCKTPGEIVLTVHQTMIVRDTPFYNRGVVKGNESLNEDEKKLVAHRVRLGDEISIPSHNQSWCETRDIRLIAKFIFKYRPLEFLIAEGIAPSNLLKRKAYDDDDSRTADKARLQTLRNSIISLNKKIADRNSKLTSELKKDLPSRDNLENAGTADDDGYDSEIEYDKARLYSMHATETLLLRRLNQQGEIATKKKKMT